MRFHVGGYITAGISLVSGDTFTVLPVGQYPRPQKIKKHMLYPMALPIRHVTSNSKPAPLKTAVPAASGMVLCPSSLQ